MSGSSGGGSGGASAGGSGGAPKGNPGGAPKGSSGGTPKGGSASKSGTAKEMFSGAKDVFKDNRNNGAQSKTSGGQADNSQEEAEAGSVQDTARSSGKGKQGAQKAKDTAKKGKQLLDAAKNVKALAPLVSALSAIGIALLIIFLIIGFLGFFTTLPGLAMEKFTEACKNFWNWVVGAETIEIKETDLVELANYIQDLGYELVGNGFGSKDQIERDETTGEVLKVSTKYEGEPGDTPNYLYAYILQNERTYTLRGVEKTGLGKLLSWIPGISKFEEWIEDSVRNSNYLESPESYGMLHFDPDDMNSDWWNTIDDFTPSIDRENMKLSIKTGFWTVSQMNWDLDGWTGRYGKPIELSLALHLSTMAPDFVYDFCMDKDLQTDIELGAQEVEYTAEYTYVSNDGLTLTSQQVIDEYNEHVDAVNINENYDALFREEAKLEPYTWNGSEYKTATIDTMSGTNIVTIRKWNMDSEDWSVEESYKALDKDGNPIKLFNRANGDLISYTVEIDSSGKPTFTEDSSVDGLDLNDMYLDDCNFSSNNNIYDIKLECISVQDMISVLNGGDDNSKYHVCNYLWDEMGRDNNVVNQYGLNHFLTGFDNCIKYIKTEDDTIYWYQPEDGYMNYYHNKAGEIFDTYGEHLREGPQYFRERNDVDNLCESLIDLLVDITGRVQQDKEKVLTYTEPIIAKKTAELNQWGLDADTFYLLYKVMSSQSTNVHTFKPYIKKVTHHWYKDVYFMPDDEDYANGKVPEDWEEAYDFTKEIQDDTGEYNPEGLANTEDIQKLKETGKIMYTLNGTGDHNKDVVQINQPYIIRTETWHNKVKNWLTSGYFFIYDGTTETAEEIEAARKVLKDEYDPSNPLLISYENDKLLVDSENNKDEIVDDIDARAKELNDILASTEYKDGKKYKVRLQKINFAKKSSLAAFSILEGVHTKDGEYVYRDLKEFMIELGYFTEADFETIETGVLDWIIPEYVPDEWPNIKYEKKDDEYGTYIRSASSIKQEREEEQKKLDEASKKEEQIAEGNTGASDGSTDSSGEENSESEETTETESGEIYNPGDPVSKSTVYEEYAESGQGYETVITVNGITYKNFKQGDFPNIPYSEGSIATSGCGATSTAIVLSGYGYDVSVPEVANWITANSVPTTWDANQKALEHFGGITSKVIIGGNTKQDTMNYVEQIRKAFSEGKPVIANVKPSVAGGNLYTSYGHYIVLLGEDQNGTVLVSDPNGRGVDNVKNKFTSGLEELVRLYLTEESSAVGGILIPDQVPKGVSFSKKLEGFKAGLKVITPGEGIVLNATKDSITIKFTAQNSVNNMTMKIEGIEVNEEIVNGNVIVLEKEQEIGTTTDEDIKLLMRDEKKAIINNIEDYIVIKKGLGTNSVVILDNDYDVDTSCDKNVIRNIDDFRKMFPEDEYNGNIYNNAQAFLDMQEKYGVNAVFAACVTIAESGGGTGWDAIPSSTYNWFSISGSHNGKSVYTNRQWCAYDSFADAVDHFGELISSSSYYFKAGRKTISEIAPTYCNAEWGVTVSEYMTERLERLNN